MLGNALTAGKLPPSQDQMRPQTGKSSRGEGNVPEEHHAVDLVQHALQEQVGCSVLICAPKRASDLPGLPSAEAFQGACHGILWGRSGAPEEPSGLYAWRMADCTAYSTCCASACTSLEDLHVHAPIQHVTPYHRPSLHGHQPSSTCSHDHGIQVVSLEQAIKGVPSLCIKLQPACCCAPASISQSDTGFAAQHHAWAQHPGLLTHGWQHWHSLAVLLHCGPLGDDCMCGYLAITCPPACADQHRPPTLLLITGFHPANQGGWQAIYLCHKACMLARESCSSAHSIDSMFWGRLPLVIWTPAALPCPGLSCWPPRLNQVCFRRDGVSDVAVRKEWYISGGLSASFVHCQVGRTPV